MRPNCYECIHRREAGPGTAHSSCHHPSSGIAGGGGSPLAQVLSLLGKRAGPVVNLDAATELGIVANSRGLTMGWFNWPYNFDPAWLQECDGFEAKQKKEEQQPDEPTPS